MSTETEEKKEETQETTEFDLENMSEEDIDSLEEDDLDKLQEQLEAQEPDEGAETQDKAGEPSSKEAEEKTDDTEGAKETPAGEESSGDEETVESLKAKIEKMQTHEEEQRKFNERRGNEVGDLRGQVQTMQQQMLSGKGVSGVSGISAQEKERLQELANTDQVAFHQEMDAIKDRNANAQNLQQQTELNTMVTNNKNTIADIVPDWEKDSADIETYLSTIIPAQDARAFVSNPSQDRTGPMILKLSTDTVLERKKNATLQKQVTDLTTKLKGVQDKINSAASKKKGLGNIGTGSASTGADDGEVTEADIDAMDGPALEEFLAKQARIKQNE